MRKHCQDALSKNCNCKAFFTDIWQRAFV